MQNILVTGASGFIGRNITKTLQRAGYKVRALYRRAEPPRELNEAAESGAELIRGDLVKMLGNNAAAELVEGVEVIIHTAAKVTTTGKWSAFEKINIDVTSDLLKRAEDEGVKRFVYLSSMAVHGFGEHMFSNEAGPYYRLITNYQKSKKAAENLVSAYRGDRLSTIILRPGLVYGPGDTTTLKPALDLLSAGKMPMIGGFHVYSCHVYIDDFVQAVKLAVEADGLNGEVFDIAGDDMVTLREAIFTAAALMGTDAPKIDLPPMLANTAGAVLDLFHRVFRIDREPLVSRYLAQQLSNNFHFSSEKAKKLLGYSPGVNWQEGIKKTVEAYLRENRTPR